MGIDEDRAKNTRSREDYHSAAGTDAAPIELTEEEAREVMLRRKRKIYPSRLRDDRLKRRQRRAKLAQLIRSGVTDRGMLAEALQVGKTTVGKDIAWLDRQWQMNYLQDMQVAKARAFAELEQVKRAAWIEFNASRGETKKITTKKKDGSVEVTETVETTTGDPKYLGIVLQALRQESDMRGFGMEAKMEYDRETKTNRFGVEILLALQQHAEENRGAGRGGIVIDASEFTAELLGAHRDRALPQPLAQALAQSPSAGLSQPSVSQPTPATSPPSTPPSAEQVPPSDGLRPPHSDYPQSPPSAPPPATPSNVLDVTQYMPKWPPHTSEPRDPDAE